MSTSDGVMLAAGEGRRIVGGGIDATVKVTLDHPSFTSTFKVRVPPGYDVGARVHTEGEEVFFVIKGVLDILAFEPIDLFRIGTSRNQKMENTICAADLGRFCMCRPASRMHSGTLPMTKR